MIARILGITGCVLLLGGCITDCATGYTSYKQGCVVRKYYVPSETTISVDSDGMLTVETDPEEWRVVFDVEGYEADLNLGEPSYHSCSIGDKVPIGRRTGRWTRFPYATFVAPGAVVDSELTVEK